MNIPALLEDIEREGKARKCALGEMELYLTSGGALAPPDHIGPDGDVSADAVLRCLLGETESYAHLYPSGIIKRYGKQIWTFSDLVFTEAS